MFLDETTVGYQPIVALADGTVVGHEAVVRWQDPHRPHSQLAARLEDLDALHQLGAVTRSILETARRDWPELGGDLHVDISAHDLADGAVLDLATAVAAEAPAGCGALVLELIERQPIRDCRALGAGRRRLRSAGVRLALDDFGVGWSNMRSLQVFEPEMIKLDGRLLGAHDNLFLVEWLLAVARNVGAEACVDAVGCEELATRLRQLGVPKGQGLAFGYAARQPARSQGSLSS